MSWKRNAAITAVLGGVISVVALLTGVPSAKADELADLRANQELLQQRLDQLAQAPPGAPPATAGVGSFPRSFLIPGTDTSMRVGGQAVGSVLWYLKGAATGGALNGTGSFNETFTDGQGGTGNLPGIPLKGTAAVNAVGFAPSRSSEWIMSGKQSLIFLDVRQPSPWGEIKAFVSFDMSAARRRCATPIRWATAGRSRSRPRTRPRSSPARSATSIPTPTRSRLRPPA